MEKIVNVNIKTEQIYPHPENPRKDLGDLTEMVESIKKNGIMQNLTVIPISALSKEPEEQPDAETISLKSDFHALIGHRRLEAAKLAGLSEVPCNIVSKISRKEQVGIMLEENMQRNDLTIYEQAQGFQMMLDLGETEDSIAEKTGFSKKTIKHRLNIAKLDQKELKKKEQDDSFQLTLKDLYELEKVEDIKTRNKILKEARDSRDLVWKAQSAVSAAAREKREKKIVAFLKKAGVDKAPKGAENEQYSGKWKILKEFDLDKDVPEELTIPKRKKPIYYLTYYRSVRIITKMTKEKEKESPQEIERKKREKNRKEIKAKIKKMNARSREFIVNIVSGKIDAIKETAAVQEEIWYVLLHTNAYLQASSMEDILSGKSYWERTPEEKEEVTKKVEKLSFLHQMLLQMQHSLKGMGEISNYDGTFNESRGTILQKAYAILEKYGWSFEEDEEQLLNGTHELYTKKG